MLADGYKQQVLADSPLRYYRMDDATSTMVDSSGSGGNGTHFNSPTLLQSGALKNDPNTSIGYNGTTQYSRATIDLGFQTRITVECWLWWVTNAADDKLAFEFGTPAYATLGQNGFIFDPNNSTTDNTKTMFGLGNSGQGWADGFPKASTGAWHHYVFDLNRTGPALIAYVDGVQQTLTTILHNAASGGTFGSTNLYLMSRSGSSLFCAANSLIDEFAIYGGGLSAARVKAHYSAGIRRESGLYVPRSLAVVQRSANW